MKIKLFIIILLLVSLSIIFAGLYIKSTNNPIQSELTDGRIIGAYFLNEENTEITLEIARSLEAKRLGLQYREELNPNSGMLFVYSDENFLTFWMLNTLIPLDIIFLDEDLTIIKIHENTKVNQTDILYPSEYPAQYVLEVNAGFSEKSNLKKGIQLQLDSE